MANDIKAFLETSLKREPIIAAFKQVPMLEGISTDALIALFISADERMVRKDTVIVKEGEQGHHLYIVGKGSVDVIVGHGKPEETVVATLGQYAFFGEMCVIEPIVRSATVVARETSFLYSISSASLNKLYQVWPDQHTVIMRNLVQGLARRIEALDPSLSAKAY